MLYLGDTTLKHKQTASATQHQGTHHGCLLGRHLLHVALDVLEQVIVVQVRRQVLHQVVPGDTQTQQGGGSSSKLSMNDTVKQTSINPTLP